MITSPLTVNCGNKSRLSAVPSCLTVGWFCVTMTRGVLPPVSYKNKRVQVGSGGNVLCGVNAGLFVGMIRKDFQTCNNSCWGVRE